MDWKKIFAACETIEELKKAFKKACMNCHPDKGGTAAEFKAMQAEYEEAAQRIARGEAAGNYQHNKKKDGTYKTAEEIYQDSKRSAQSLRSSSPLKGLNLKSAAAGYG